MEDLENRKQKSGGNDGKVKEKRKEGRIREGGAAGFTPQHI
jgi:hypothetical protein